MKKKHAKRGKSGMGICLVLVLALAFTGGMLWLALAPDAEPHDDSSASLPAAPTDGTTTSSTGVPTTKETASTTSSSVSTTIRTQAPVSSELLQYDTTGHYVQKSLSDWRLILVNDWNPIDANYENEVTMVKAGNRNQNVDSRILADLNAMLTAGKAYGIDVQSGYRPYAQQSTLYWRQVNNYKSYGYNDTAAQQAAGKVVKRPGYSEHNCGLAVDLGGSSNFTLTESFANTPAYKWLIENCADYGFILRFPKGKENITGVIYEAWHFRYVGKEAAKYIMENDLCLEEYLAQTAP